MIYVRESTGTIKAVTEKVKAEAVAYNFGVLDVRDLTEQMRNRQIDFPAHCLVIELADPALSKECLQIGGAFLTLISPRIFVCWQGAKVSVSAQKLAPFIPIDASPDLRRQAELTDRALQRIIDNSCAPIARVDKVLDWNMS
jgi:uncharacterized protein (DUF302 family)